jgi:hypothetical protein
MDRADCEVVADEMLGDGPRRWVDPYSVIAADLLRARLRRKEDMCRAIDAYKAGKPPRMVREAANG